MMPPTPRTILAAAVALALAVGTASVVAAAEPTTERTAALAGEAGGFDELPPVLPGADSFRSHRDLLGVDLDSTAYNQVRSVYDETAGELGGHSSSEPMPRPNAACSSPHANASSAHSPRQRRAGTPSPPSWTS